jgi:para-aminobenzoate synthetase component 1
MLSLPLNIEAWSRLPEMDGVVFYLHRGERNTVLVALGAEETVNTQKGGLEALKQTLLDNTEWWFGSLSYELKSETESVSSPTQPYVSWPSLCFVKPKVVLECTTSGCVFLKGKEYESLLANATKIATPKEAPIVLEPILSEDQYMKALTQVREYLQRGDIYEVNYCQEFRGEGRLNSPWNVFVSLDKKTEAPHAAYVQLNHLHLLCASPERYMKREGNKLMSQPIKGTIKRGKTAVEDDALKMQLRLSEKEQAENVMIVDLVRNDLSRIATRGSVQVEELFGTYSFKTVHHLISTVTAEVDASIGLADVLRASFPMGSMTGAPKVRAMQIADELEISARGIYSGAVGYVAPNGDFDFNVVIRSLVYDHQQEKISLHVGGAITMQSSFESEYQECLLKAEAARSVLEQR